MSESHEAKHHDTSTDEATAGKSPKRTLIVTIIMLGFAVLTFIPPLVTRKPGDFIIAIWETLVLVAVFSSMTLVKRLIEAERSRDAEMRQAPVSPQSP